jgi:hypothetical protein
MRGSVRRCKTTSLAVALASTLVGAATAAAAAAPPAVVTGGAARVTSQAATLTGTVNPRGLATTYHFQYGTTRTYGARTPATPTGAGRRAVPAVADLIGLSPATTYHYRLVAHSRGGTARGADRTFRTARQPLGLSLAAVPNPVRFGGGAMLSGTLSGTGNANRQVVLEQNAFPFTTGFAAVGNPQVTDAAGAFGFPLLLVPVTTQYRVVTATRPPVVSPIVTLGVAVRVTTHLSRARVHRGGRVRFFGRVMPARPGARYGVQRRGRRGRWVTVAGGSVRQGGPGYSRYARRVRINRGGVYRVFIQVLDGQYVSTAGPAVRVRTRG